MMKPFAVQLHDLISLSAPGLPECFRKKIRSNVSRFVSENLEKQPEKPDIIALPMGSLPHVDEFASHMNHLFGFCMIQYNKRDSVCLMHMGKPYICLLFSSSTIEIRYGKMSGKDNIFWGVILFCLHLALKRKNSLLCHGAVAEKDGAAVLFSGHQGTGKTPILLYFLKHNWNYLSDDKFILADKKLFLMEKHINVQQYHFEILPWLSPYIEHQIKKTLPVKIKKILYLAVNLFWPAGDIPVKVSRYLNPGTRIDLNQERFSRQVVESTRPVHWFIMQKGKEFSIDTLPRSQAIEKISLLQKLFFAHRFALETTASFYCNTGTNSVKQILNDNLPDIKFSLITFSDEQDINRNCERILSHCE